MSIEKRYYVRVDTNRDVDIEEALGRLVYNPDLKDLDVFEGNACCDPYVTWWCPTKGQAEKYLKLVKELLNED